MILKTSGTTGTPKTIEQPKEKLKVANEIARQSQEIKKDSKIYTVCKITHAGGMLAQTRPAQDIGAEVTIEDFNAYRFVRKINDYTHTHITPGHARLIMQTKSFKDLDLTGIWVTCGSDPVDWDIIEAFVQRGSTFMANWGMTEVGPCAINHVFKTLNDVKQMKSDETILGSRIYCDYKIVNSELVIRGNISVYGYAWFPTGDLVEEKNGALYYLGRK